ncbi:LPS export ABC transporter permease LptG [Alkalilimnicola ehrlichii MLHE-1]|uniref:Permease YjgP/YjgQ family protein n=1 Tax=Alkalilimnicola ehrlichii (strain ATCC BAA-1101 / DSM 17681 / MLHE-1) TaxID=187272 RepID=Q0AB73_ALKEH|nr:LPS export ABC transporter permease LptG [Alkalilimnicola ehrlichii]ABI55914.1 permease YjgP/YjgQ family protein [Alkalilimnicola ehrlichii MLHE-1]
MIRLLDRYLIITVVASALVALVVIMSLDLVFSFVDEGGDIGTADYGPLSALAYVLLSSPSRAYEAFPFATLIGALMGLGALAARNELTVMRAAGVSVLQIARAVAAGGLVLALIAMAMGEWVVPPAERAATELRASAMARDVGISGAGGLWARDGGQFIEVRRARSPAHLEGLTIYHFEERDGEPMTLRRVLSGSEALFRDGRWILREPGEVHLHADGISVADLGDEKVWESALSPAVLDVVVVDPESLSMADLRTYIGYLEANELDSGEWRLAFWVKVATPISTLAMLLLTIPLVFGAVRSTGAGQRIFIGVLIGVAFFLVNRMLNHAGVVFGLPPSASALLPAFAFLAAGILGILKVR